MRRCRATLTVLALTLLTLLVAGPAQAGGPTSVLLVVPGSGQTASLYYNDADYDSLAGLVGASGTGDTMGKVDESGTVPEPGAEVTLTWLIHDVQVWGVDRVYPDADGGPWISTQMSATGSDNIWESPTVWHTTNHGLALTSLLARLGVRPASLGTDNAAATGGNGAGGNGAGGNGAGGNGAGGNGAGGDGAGGDIAPSFAPSTAPPAAAQSKQRANQPANAVLPGLAGLLWGFGGLGLGVAVTVLAMRRSSNSRPRIGRPATVEQAEDGDVEMPAVHHGSDSERTWSAAEEMTWPSRRR